MSKTVLANVDGFTPVIDGLVEKYGFMTALVFGVIWRYCQLKDGKCTASQETLANKIGVKRQTFFRHAKLLVENGYLESNTKRGLGIEYTDTGKANLSFKVTARVIESDSTCNPKVQPPVTLDDTKILNEETIKDINTDEAIKIYNEVTGLTPDAGNYPKVAANIKSAYKQRSMDMKQFITYLRGVYHNWKGTKSKDGRPYSPMNPTWIEWAITGRYLEDQSTVKQGKERGFYA